MLQFLGWRLCARTGQVKLSIDKLSIEMENSRFESLQLEVDKKGRRVGPRKAEQADSLGMLYVKLKILNILPHAILY